jgi:calcineurin-like phosphoesterase family protein
MRPFETIEEHDEILVQRWNSVVRPQDKVYHLGDVVMNRSSLPIVSRLNGRKILIKGNHDKFTAKEYVDAGFEDIQGAVVFKSGFMLTHIPVHTCELERWRMNIHGHHHNNFRLKDDLRYICVSMERLPDWTPVSWDWILAEIERRNLNVQEFTPSECHFPEPT